MGAFSRFEVIEVIFATPSSLDFVPVEFQYFVLSGP